MVSNLQEEKVQDSITCQQFWRSVWFEEVISTKSNFAKHKKERKEKEKHQFLQIPLFCSNLSLIWQVLLTNYSQGNTNQNDEIPCHTSERKGNTQSWKFPFIRQNKKVSRCHSENTVGGVFFLHRVKQYLIPWYLIWSPVSARCFYQHRVRYNAWALPGVKDTLKS